MPLVNIPVGVNDLVEWIGSVNDGFHHPGLYQFIQKNKIVGGLGRR
jgi:hypothetical protein